MHLERLEQAVGWDAIVTADRDAARAKPNPTHVSRGARRCSASPRTRRSSSRTRRTASRAGKAAGIFVVGVPNEVTRELGLDDADLVVDSLAELPPDELLARFS